MKKLLCTMALAMTLCNVLFAQEVKVGDSCKNGQSACPPSNDGTLYGTAQTGTPRNVYEYTCEYWMEWKVKDYNRIGYKIYYQKLKDAIKTKGLLESKGMMYDASQDRIRCLVEKDKKSVNSPFDASGKVSGGCFTKFSFNINGTSFTKDCNLKNVKDLKTGLDTISGSMLRQTNLKYDKDVGGLVNLNKQDGVMNGKNYVNGDYALTANSVLNYYTGLQGNYDSASTSYKQEGNFGFNSSKQNISLPPKLKPEDIVFARLYWAGNIHSGQDADYSFRNTVLNNSLTSYGKSKISNLISGYRKVTMSIDGADAKDYYASDEDVYYDYSLDYGAGGLYFMYSNSVDVKEDVKEVISSKQSKFDTNVDQPVEISITVGNVKSNNTNTRLHYTSALNTTTLYDNVYIANYGNWSLLIVYDKKDNIGIKPETMKKYYKPKFVTLYHGMSELLASIGKAYMTFNMEGFYTPTHDNYDARVSFFTNQNVGYSNEATGGVMKFQKSKTKTGDDNNDYKTIPVKPGSNETWLYPGIFVTEAGSANGKELGYKNTGAIGMYTRNVDEFMFGSQTQTSAKFGVNNRGSQGEQSLLSYMVFSTDVYKPRICYAYHIYSENGERDQFSAVRGDQIKTVIKFKNESAQGEKSETAFGVIAKFTMDSNNTYNKNTLILNNNTSGYTTFKSYEEAVDKVIKSKDPNNGDFAFLRDNENGAYKNQDRTEKFTSGIYYDKKLNEVTTGMHKKTEYKREIEYTYEEVDGKQRIKCERKSANSNECKLDANGDIIPIDYKVKITPFEVSYNTTDVKLAIGKDIASNEGFTGGKLDVGDQVFVEYTSTLGDRYVQNAFSLDFSQNINGKIIKYTGTINDLERCKPEPGDVNDEQIKVIPLNGLRVVNQNITQNDVDKAIDKLTGRLRNSFNNNLYTQIGGREFKANLVYTPDVSRSVTMNPDGTVTVYDQNGRTSRKMKYEDFIAQATKDTKFNSYGVVYLSLIPKETLLDKKNKKECKDLTIGMYKSSGTPITGSDTVPFYYDSFPKKVKIGVKTQNEMEQEVNKGYQKNHPHPSYAVDFNGKNFLPLEKLKVDYDMDNYTFVVSYAPYKVNQKEFKDGVEDGKISDEVKECQNEYNKGYDKCSSESAKFCSDENHQKQNGGSYSSCLVSKNQPCLAVVSKKYQNCIGGSKEIIKDAVVNKQGLFNVCASDNFAVRPKFIRYNKISLPRYLAGIKMSESFQRFKAENDDKKPAYGYNTVLTPNDDTTLEGAKIIEQNTLKDDYKPYDPTSQSLVSVIAPVLPQKCKVDNVVGVKADGTINRYLWKNTGMSIGADFRLRTKGSNVIDESKIRDLEAGVLNDYRKSVRPSGGQYKLGSKYDEYGYVYTTPNANDNLKGDSKNQKTMSLEYYNIGWAGFTLVDSKWTNHDQGSGDCILGSFSNEPTNKGLVGCNVGLVVGDVKDDANKNQKWVYAAFDYDKVDVDLLDLKDAFNKTDGTQGKLQNDASRPVNFTYFYNGDTKATTGSRYIASDNLDPTNGMGATMQLKSTARLATQANVDGKIQNALYFGVNSTKNGVEIKTVNGATVNRGIIPTLFNENCYAQTVTFDLDNRYMPKNVTTNANDDHTGLGRNNNAILQSSRNWTFENFAINTMFVQGQTKQTNFDTTLTKPFQMLNTGFANGVNNGNFYINFLKSNLVGSSTGGGTGARNPLIIVAEDFNASADLDVCANPKACVIPAKNTTPTYDPNDIFNSFANGSDRRIQAVATTGNPSYYYNAIDRKTTPLNATNLATNPVGVARFYYGNFNNAQVRPVGTQQLNVASNYFIQPMIYCDDKANGNACFNNLFPLFGLATGENEADLVIDAGQRPNFYLNRAFTYGNAGGLDITNNLRTSYGGGTSSVSVKPNNMLSATGNQKNYSEQISVIISGGAGTTQEVRIFVKPWFLSDYSSANLNYNRFFVNAAGGAAWAGAGGVKEDKAKKRELRNVGSFLNDTDVTTDGNSKNRTNRITW